MSTGPGDVRPRRAVFQLGLRKLVEPLAVFIEERLVPVTHPPRNVLRPPGAIGEADFLKACYRCGNCVDVCPAAAVRVMNDDDPELRGTPYIDADLSACMVCADLSCTKVCPSGGLVKLASAGDIRMGLARVSGELCLRSSGRPCTLCVDKCPLGSTAIRISSHGNVEVLAGGCVGCGMCQFYCPTRPRAIIVEPF